MIKKMETEELKIGGKRCFLWQGREDSPVAVLCTYPHRPDEMERFTEAFVKELPDGEVTLAAFYAEDWNADFSPWEAPPVFGTEGFAGRGRQTLSWLSEAFVPYLAERFGKERRMFIAGYSLAGLFALFAGYESELFDGVACCSGSLWFDRWDEYAAGHDIRSAKNVYLSLGGKEKKTKNPVMARVGERTRSQAERLRNDPQVLRTILEWNSGGHFADSAGRLIRGIKWLAGSAE